MFEITPGMVRRADADSYQMPIHSDPGYPSSLYYRMLKSLMEQSKVEIAVELGTCGGGAALHLGLGNPDAEVYTYENDPNMNLIWESIERVPHYAPNVRLRVGDSVEAADYFEAHTIGLIFIDTTHTYEQTMKEWNAWIDKIKVGGAVVLDDIRRPGMIEVLKELRDHPRVRDILEFSTQGGDGLAVVLV